MLIGGSKHTVDTKGRMFFPARFKEELWEDITVCRGVEKCLMLFSKAEWEVFANRIKSQPFTVSSKLERYFFSTAAQCGVDGQGRLLLPQQLRDFVGIEKDIWVIGAQNRAEIWDYDEWVRAQSSLTNEDVGELMDKIGF